MKFSSALVAIYLGLATATPVYRSVSNSKRVVRRSSHLHKRQVPQEHSHDFVLTITKEMLNLDNPKEIADPVFGLLGDAAAADGAGSVTNLACLKQETADQAFTNAKAIGDLRGMAGSLLFQAIERNTAGVGVASKLCTDKAVNPEIAALTQHQDAASEGAGAINKAVTLELAKQLAGIGADPNLALLSGTFAPGDTGDSTGKGNSCDEEEPDLGCIFSQNLLVLDATEDEISSAVANVAQTFTGTGGIFATELVDLASFSVASVTEVADLATIVQGAAGGAATNVVATDAAATDAAATDAATATSATDSANAEATAGAGKGCAAKSKAKGAVLKTLVPTGFATRTAGAASATTGNGAKATDSVDKANGDNIQSFTGTLGGPAPPVVSSTGDKPFSVNGNTFNGASVALGRSCDIQHNACANAANSGELSGGVGQCETQLEECRAAAGA
ncbi:related to cell wall mannoprotein [Fusarium torulosum]|uniref:Related to cell wall mannoprotein n=1 Tax=Fusarium torulosum TaxID=33205 RepID=A0AAE8M822_9HYPO|nr:related to cell wall mannoprotein [Fusarium torulosum]